MNLFSLFGRGAAILHVQRKVVPQTIDSTFFYQQYEKVLERFSKVSHLESLTFNHSLSFFLGGGA